MKKIILFILLICCSNSLLIAQEVDSVFVESEVSIDTLYYNSEWKVVNSKIIADYYRVIVNSPNKIDRQFRDYFMTGELQSKGGYILIDNKDDANTIFNGKCITYYRNGNIAEEKTYIDGKLNGEYTVYKENGLIINNVNFKDDKMNGIYTEFNDDGLCIQVQYYNGFFDETYTVSNSSGCLMRFNYNTNEPIWESPNIDEIKKNYKDGVAWPYYNKNGIVVSMSNSLVKDYGKYYKITLVIANNSLVPIEFNPVTSISAVSTNRRYETEQIKVLSSEDYLKKVKRSQNWQAALVGFSEGIASYNAGYTTSTTNSNTYSSGSAYACGTGGSAYGTYSGSSSTVSTVRQYDAAAAYQAKVISGNRIANFEASLLNEREIKKKGYLKRTTIQPAEVISGYVNISRTNRDVKMSVTIDINGAKYVFDWSNK